MRIGEVALRAGLRPSAIRYYERMGLLPPPRRASGRRQYGGEVLNRLAVIRYARQTGFTMAEIKRLVSGVSGRTPPAERWRVLANRKITEIDAWMEKAAQMRGMLERALRCNCPTLEDCGRAFLSKDKPSRGAAPGETRAQRR